MWHEMKKFENHCKIITKIKKADKTDWLACKQLEHSHVAGGIIK